MSERADQTPTYSEGARKRRERRRTSSVTQLARQVTVGAAEEGTEEAMIRGTEVALSLWRSEIEARVKERCEREHAAELRDLRAHVRALEGLVKERDETIRRMRGGR